jgi:hypothetical protein
MILFEGLITSGVRQIANLGWHCIVLPTFVSYTLNLNPKPQTPNPKPKIQNQSANLGWEHDDHRALDPLQHLLEIRKVVD